MNIHKVTAGVVLAALALLPGLLAAAPATAQAQTTKEKRTDQKGSEQKGQLMPFDQLPQPIQQTIIQASEGGTVGPITIETRGGKPFYVAQITGPKGKKRYVRVNEDGTLMK